MTEKEVNLLRRVEEAGGSCFMSYGDTSTVKRLTARGLLRWEQTSPFVATIIATEAGSAALHANTEIAP